MASFAIPAIHLKWVKFCHASQLALAAMWFVACILMYWHAPSFQAEQLYDCRWHLSCLAISAGFGFLFLRSPSSLLFAVTFVAAQYSVVYSFLSLVIYGVDSLMVLNSDPSTAITAAVTGTPPDFTGYLRLAAVIIVLSMFGLGVSLVYVHRLYLIGWDMSPPKRVNGGLRAIQIFSGLHCAFALFTMYVVEELTPFKTWFVRVYMVHEFSCSLLSLSLAVLQMTAIVHSNTVMLKAVFIANLCQFVQELHIGTTAFYTAFYIRKLMTTVQLSDVIFRQIVVGLNLVAHIARMAMCGATAYIVAPLIWNELLTLRVTKKIDQNRLTANQDYITAVASENSWIIKLIGAFGALVLAYFGLNISYIALNSFIEAFVIATGMSFMFSILVLCSIVLYFRKRYRLALLCICYFAMNIIVSASLLIVSFIQDMVFEPAKTEKSPMSLSIVEVLISIGALLLALNVLKFCVQQLISSITLVKQPAFVSRAAKILRQISLFCLLSCAVEFCLLLELRVEAKSAHLSMTSSVHDWLYTTVQSLFLYWCTKHERYQCMLLVMLLQLGNVSIVSLDMLAQQTDLMQMLITLLFQHDLMTAQMKASASSFPTDHFVIILVLHFLQLLQWFLTVAALAVTFFVIDNVVEDDSSKTNENHEISVLGMDIGGSNGALTASSSNGTTSNDHTNGIEKKSAIEERTPNGIGFDNALFNDPLAMSRLPEGSPERSGIDADMDDVVVDIPLDDNPIRVRN
uniref:DUF4153 domain-containing protein n=1 Tax=Panagrellus redivivus TaxID=6233 RepID=A0A7E4V6P7_PANRE